jgi:ABC-type antimicrobial peptide transport system permease subunit
MVSVAGISLLVGGIGIMNIMLVNVAERQREIGIRKAIGATDAHVINQFLIESCIIGLLGGILGYAIGIGGAYAASLYLPFAPVLQWQVAAIGIGIATTTGVLFGIYPAAKATKKNPVESLRY